MEWMVVDPTQLHSTFASLGTQVGDSYVVHDNCLTTLDEIFNKLSIEDRALHTFRRALGFSQVVKEDLLPLLINAKDNSRVVDGVIRILVNLTMPVECLVPVDMMLGTDVGHYTILELNGLLIAVKEAFRDSRSTSIIVEYMRQAIDHEGDWSDKDCGSINNCLLLLRNILHIPEAWSHGSGSLHCNLQNQILWNLFTHNVDKVLISLMTSQYKRFWGVTMVQLIALMYKDQHVGTLQKLLQLWYEASLGESSEDNESNTSPPDQASGDSSPMLTSDPTSNSSDASGQHKHSSEMETSPSEPKQHMPRMTPHLGSNTSSGKRGKCATNSRKASSKASSKKDRHSDGESGISSFYSCPNMKGSNSSHSHILAHNWSSELTGGGKQRDCTLSELSDCGYGTQVESQEFISTLGNEDDGPHSKSRAVHQKSHSVQQKPHYNVNKLSSSLLKRTEWCHKKLVKRSSINFMSIRAVLHHSPTDEDISNLLKEFTVDFLLRGYGCLVNELHRQLLRSECSLHIDTSHFFWLITYFLKFAAQLELELECISPVLSFDILSYLTYEAVNLCEVLELSVRQGGCDIKPCLRRMHLVVTAIREFFQAVNTYCKLSHLSPEDRDHLVQLQMQIGLTEDLRCLFILLLRQYDPNLQNKQYLQDVIITNHILLLLIDEVSKLPECNGNANMIEHIKHFATVEVMHQYGLLLEDFQENGEFINDCIFTMMHHVGGDAQQAAVLFQPKILKTFSKMWELDFEICDDWSDLVEFVIHKFVNPSRRNKLPSHGNLSKLKSSNLTGDDTLRWSREDSNNLYWFHAQGAKDNDPIGKLVELFAENDVSKTRLQVIEHLLLQDIISSSQYEELMRAETGKPVSSIQEMHTSKKSGEVNAIPIMLGKRNDKMTGADPDCSFSSEDAGLLRDHLVKQNKGKLLMWLQKVLVEACYVKLYYDNAELPRAMCIMEPIPYHYTLMNQSIPVVPWSSDQQSIMKHQPFILLLHKLGFHLPTDSGKVFARIPNFWTADVLLEVAEKLGPIHSSLLKFDVKLLRESEASMDTEACESSLGSSNIFTVPRPKQISSMIQFTPLPNSTVSWPQVVMHQKTTTVSSPSSPPANISIAEDLLQTGENADLAEDDQSTCSDIGAESVVSDLTRMCVSDEEDKYEASGKHIYML